MVMSIPTIIMIVVLAYIVQVLLLLSYPYYKYRQSYKDHSQRTVGGFVDFTNGIMGDGYIFLVFFPIFGFLAFTLVLLIGLIVVGFKAFYTKFIKDLNI